MSTTKRSLALVTRCCRGDPARCLQQVRVIIIIPSSSDPPEQHAWPPVRLDAAAAVVDDHVAMMVEDPNTRNEVPGDTAAGATSPLSSASLATT